MSSIVAGQLWYGVVKDANRSIGYHVVTKKEALLAQAEDLLYDISEEQGINREITSLNRASTVYLRRVLHE